MEIKFRARSCVCSMRGVSGPTSTTGIFTQALKKEKRKGKRRRSAGSASPTRRRAASDGEVRSRAAAPCRAPPPPVVTIPLLSAQGGATVNLGSRKLGAGGWTSAVSARAQFPRRRRRNLDGPDRGGHAIRTVGRVGATVRSARTAGGRIAL